MTTALLIIDVQNDYFPGGAFPLWNTDAVLDATVAAMQRAQARGQHVILIQHIAADPGRLFNADTHGVEVHPRVRAAAPDAPVVVKQFADSFHQTTLTDVLAARGVDRLDIAGMMTQNCVTHTALSRSAERYALRVLADCTTTVDETIHQFALHAMSTRVPLVDSTQAPA